MTKTTMTQVQALSLAIDFINGVDMPTDTDFNAVVEKLSAMRETIYNKKSAPSKADREKAEQNDIICGQIMNVLTTSGKLMTIRDIQTAETTLAELSNQKVSAMLKKLVDSGKVVKTVDKKVVYFSVA